jgi:hypothetical protein
VSTFDPYVESAPRAFAARQPIQYKMICIIGQASIGMEKQEHVTRRFGRSRVHLGGTAARPGYDMVRSHACTQDGRVATAAVDNDHLDAERSQIRQAIKRSGNPFAFVENG